MRLRLTVPSLAVTAAVALAVGCSTSESPGPGLPDTAVVTPRPESADAGRLAFADELGGRRVVAETSGPWAMRKSGSSDGGGPGAGGDAEVAESMSTSMELSAPATGGGGAPVGASAPTDAARSRRSDVSASPGFEGTDVDAGGEAAVEEDVVLHLDAPGASAKARAVAGRAGIGGGGGAAPAQRLRAGATDDNEDYGAYLEFLATWVERKEIQQLYDPLDVSDRRHIRVVDAGGAPVPGAVVSIVDQAADKVLWTATTYGDGRVPYYPHLDAMPVGEGGELIIEAYLRDDDDDGGGIGARTDWDGSGAEIEVALTETVASPDPVQLDVCFVIDTTGSMGDEIASIKASLLRVTDQLRGLEREFDLRYSAVLYRDIGDAYVTATHAFTADIEAFDEALRGVQAAGGGDGPESLNQAVAQAVDGVDWRPGAAKVAFLIADAPPHMDYAGDVSYGESARAAVAKGIRFHSVAASGLDPVGTLVFRQIAQFTRGKFIFIEYGSPAASAAAHGVGGKVKNDNLEDILFAQLRDEVATFGRGD